MKFYYPKAHYNENFRTLVFPLLKPFIKGENFTDAERIALYGISENDFIFTEVLEEADLVFLTMAWNYYVNTDRKDIAISFVKQCELLNKKVIAFNAGDFGVNIPVFDNLIVLRPSGYKSKFSKNEYSMPAFIEDPLPQYFNSNEIIQRPYNLKATIGFCGQANSSQINAVKETFKTFLRNFKFHVGISKNEPQQLFSTSYLRASILKEIQKSSLVTSNFILRKQYRAGVKMQKESHRTTLEFYENINSSDYVVCVRGAGNFSVRFYETLAMGRIPIFVNTDCALPLENEIDWKKHVVWIERKEIKHIAEKVKDFHSSLSSNDFIDLQNANRTLWNERLTLNGFFKTFRIK